MRIIIVGGGKVGRRLAKFLIAQGHDVTIVEKNPEVAKDLSTKLDAEIIEGDGVDQEVLIDAGIENADCVVVTTPEDDANMLICEIAKKFGVKKIISRISNPENYELFLKIGVQGIGVTTATVNNILNAILALDRRILTSICGDRVVLTHAIIGENSPSIGKKIGDLKLHGIVFCLERGGDVIFPNKDTAIREGDVLYAAIMTEGLEDFFKQTVG